MPSSVQARKPFSMPSKASISAAPTPSAPEMSFCEPTAAMANLMHSAVMASFTGSGGMMPSPFWRALETSVLNSLICSSVISESDFAPMRFSASTAVSFARSPSASSAFSAARRSAGVAVMKSERSATVEMTHLRRLRTSFTWMRPEASCGIRARNSAGQSRFLAGMLVSVQCAGSSS